MNTKERLAWAKHLDMKLPLSETGESERIIIPGKLPSKANSYEIRLDPSLWQLIQPIVTQWRAKTQKRPWWISPSDAVKAYEEMAAHYIQTQERFRYEDNLALEVDLFGQHLDVDNLKAIPDAIQLSGIINNDRQFTKLNIEKLDDEQPRVEIYITQIK